MTLDVALGKLRRLEYVLPGQPIRATPEGVAQAGDVETLPPPGPDLVEYWKYKLGKAERAILEVMIAAHPEQLSRLEIAERTGYAPQTSTLDVALGKLRRMELLEGFRVSENLIGW